MATQLLHATSLISGSVSDPENAFGPLNGVFTTDTGNTNWIGRWALGSIEVSHSLSGVQQFSIRIRADEEGGNAPSVDRVQLYQDGLAIGDSRFSGEVTTSGEGVDVTFEVASSDLSGSEGIAIEVEASGSGGQRALRRSIQVDAFTWTAEYVAAFGTPMKVYQSGQWKAGSLKYYDGVDWVEKPAKVYQNGQWVVI